MANVKIQTALESCVCWCPFGSDIRKALAATERRMSEPGHQCGGFAIRVNLAPSPHGECQIRTALESCICWCPFGSGIRKALAATERRMSEPGHQCGGFAIRVNLAPSPHGECQIRTALESCICWCPFGSDIRKALAATERRMSEPGHQCGGFAIRVNLAPSPHGECQIRTALESCICWCPFGSGIRKALAATERRMSEPGHQCGGFAIRVNLAPSPHGECQIRTALESCICWCPFGSDIRKALAATERRMSEPGHQCGGFAIRVNLAPSPHGECQIRTALESCFCWRPFGSEIRKALAATEGRMSDLRVSHR